MIYPVVPCWIGGVHAGDRVQRCEEGGCYWVGEVGEPSGVIAADGVGGVQGCGGGTWVGWF